MSYSVIFRSGNTEACDWIRIIAPWTNLELAQKRVNRLATLGYHAEVRDTNELDKIGLPIGWDSESVDFELDYIVVDRFHTRWIRNGKMNDPSIRKLARVISSLDASIINAGGTAPALDTIYDTPDPLSTLLDIMARNDIVFQYRGADK